MKQKNPLRRNLEGIFRFIVIKRLRDSGICFMTQNQVYMLQHCIYVLFSEKDHLLYIGYTKDVEARVRKHSEGGVKSTKGRRPLIVNFYEYYLFKEDA